jgi:hypothetical protein
LSADRPAAKPQRAIDKPMTRRGCVLGVAAWLVVMALPVCALVFAARGELSWQRGPFTADRVWLVNMESGRGQERASGLAYSASRVRSRPPAGSEGAVCVETDVYFFLWRGQSEAVTYCECFRPRPGAEGEYELLGECP